MVYTFQGCQRLQLWFGSPNTCALFLVILAVLCGLIDCLLSTTGKDRVYVIARWINRLTLLLELIGIALTYSRGAYLALILSLIILAWLLRQRRVLVWCGIFALSLLVLPHTGTRVASIADIGNGSISHRLMLWEGVCAIIAEHPLKGVPLREVGMRYTAWYQPLYFDDGYRTATNDLLTFAAAFGLPLSWMVMTLSLIAIILEGCCIRYQLVSKWRYAYAGIVTIWSSCFIAGLFNTFWIKPGFAIGYILPLVAFPFLFLCVPKVRMRIGKIAIFVCIVTLGIHFAIYALGRYTRDVRNYCTQYTHFDNIGNTVLLLARKSIGTVIFIHVSSDKQVAVMHDTDFHLRDWTLEIRKSLRPAVFHQLNATSCYLTLGEDWEKKIASLCTQLVTQYSEIATMPIWLLTDGKCNNQLLNTMTLLPNHVDWRLGLYAPSAENLMNSHEGMSVWPYPVTVFTSDAAFNSYGTGAVCHLERPLSPYCIDPRLPYLRMLNHK